MHLHPAFLQAFNNSTEQHKSEMLEKLMADWLQAGGHPVPVNHCAALVELLISTGSSAARRCLVEQLVCSRLVSSLCEKPTQSVAARCTAMLLEAYAPATALLTDSLVSVLLRSGPQSQSFHDGLTWLAEASPRARRDIFPALLSAIQAEITSGTHWPGSHTFESVARGAADIAFLRGFLAQSPYRDALDNAFPRAHKA